MNARGGKKLARFLRKAKAAQARPPVVISIGFHDKVIGALAAQLEFGNPETNLPERPAFRLAVQTIRRDLSSFIVRERLIDPLKMVVDDRAAREIAKWCVEVLKRSYHDLEAPRESERQQERKGFSDPLVGHEGPKLIERIAAEINGVRVDE